MKKPAGIFPVILWLAILAVSISACGAAGGGAVSDAGSGTGTGSNAVGTASERTPDPVTLNIFLFGTDNMHYRNINPVIAEFEKRTGDTLNTRLNIVWTPSGEYTQKLPLWIASGEDMDLVFDAPWRYLGKFASDGVYRDLEKYFGNDDYPGLKTAFPAEYLNDNRFYGKICAIPVTNTFMDMEGVYYRKDLLDQYGMKPIATYDDLYAFLAKAAERENPNTIMPFATYGKWGFWVMFQEPGRRAKEAGIYSFNPGTSASYIDVQLSPDRKSVSGIAAYGDTEESYRNFDKWYGKEYVLNYFNNCKKFSSFIDKNIFVNSAATGVHYAAVYGTIRGYVDRQAQEEKDIPGAKFEFWPIHEEERNMLPGARVTDYKAWNYLCIPVTSAKADRTMKFIDWVYGSQENNDLFNYGIEGVNWVAAGEGQWALKEGVDQTTNYLWPGYQLGWSPVYHRTPENLPERAKRYYQYQFNKDTYYKSDLAGFTFNTDSVKGEVAKCSSIAESYLQLLGCGIYDDTEAKLKEMHEKMAASGIDRIKAELKRQLEEFLASKKK
jgi:putative aldouronate transport system substrate-binding protein